MLNHGKALMIKAMLVFPVVWLTLTVFFDVSLLDSTLLGLAILLVGYAGDMTILPSMGNLSATIGDFVLTALILWLGLDMLGYEEYGTESLLTAAVVAAGEYFYHKWLSKEQLAPEPRETL